MKLEWQAITNVYKQVSITETESGDEYRDGEGNIFTLDKDLVDAEIQRLEKVEQIKQSKIERDKRLASIIYEREDGTRIQMRDPKFGSEYLIMSQLVTIMSEDDEQNWIDVDNKAILLTKSDMRKALSYQRKEISDIYDEYIKLL